ncbi:MAG: DUF707 domain-containing protein, partial [Ancalomicrobiaceae bacterium]|nr:DUF707 domain-containing protein [Ancalomicrobiaceae bacterium]
IALAHYLLVGEARGCRPTPFFDPDHARAAHTGPAGTSVFACFLAAGATGPAAAEFDADWYARQGGWSAASGLSPWQHYRRYGLPALKDPSPDVSIAFVLTAYHKRPGKLARTLMGVFARRSPPSNRSLPLSRRALTENQDRFRQQIAFEVVAARADAGHADLVFVQTNGRHPADLHRADRPFDLMLNYYSEPAGPAPDADYVIRQNGTKVTAIDLLLKRAPEFLTRYERVLFLDDDVEISAAAIGQLFSVMAQEHLHLAQPALTADSSSHHRVLTVAEGSQRCRQVSAVEIMMPALSREAIEAVGPLFGAGVSGYGIDFLLGKAVSDRFGAAVAVVDAAVARHAAPVDLGNGPFYRLLAQFGLDPHVEMWTLIAEYGLMRTIVAVETP